MNCIIIDDDPVMVHVLEKLIDEFDFFNRVASTTNVKDAIHILEKESIDLIFLDIEMPNINGIEFLKFFPLNDIKVIIISSEEKYAIESYEFKVSDYLLKPFDKNRFYRSILKVKNELKTIEKSNIDNTNIFLKINSIYHSFRLYDIVYIECNGDYLDVHVQNEKITVHSTMKKIEQLLPKAKFIRIHNSYIVNIDKIDRIEDNMIYIGSLYLPISRSQKSKLIKVLNIL